MQVSKSLAAGLAGTSAVAVIHESLKKIIPSAPRMDLLDMEALSKLLEGFNLEVPGEDQLFKLTTAGEIISHTLYFGLIGTQRKGAWFRGVISGLVAGISAVLLPKPLRLKDSPYKKSPQTEIMTIAMYVAGGVTAAATCTVLNKKNK